jgi:hypothetical protein
VRADLGARTVAMRECFITLPDDPARDSKLALVLVHARWHGKRWGKWLALARHAELAIGWREGELVVVTALRNALLVSDCEPEALTAIGAAAARIVATNKHDRALDARLAKLERVTKEQCAALHAPTR